MLNLHTVLLLVIFQDGVNSNPDNSLHFVNTNYDEKHKDEISIEEEHIKEKQIDKSVKVRERRSATSCSETIQRSMSSPNLHVFLTVSSLGYVSWSGNVSKRNLELNWVLPSSRFAQSGDYIGLFKDDPQSYLGSPVVSVNPNSGSYFLTEEQFPDTSILMLDTELLDQCLFHYWIAYVREDRVLSVNCIKTRPRWMREMKDTLGSVPLHSLMIPGTHNSGSHMKLRGVADDTVWYRYSVNQEEDIWSQLLLGIRYLDLRVSYDSETQKFWLVHDFVPLNPLSGAIQAVKRFLRSTQELVIMDFHRFPAGFKHNTRQRHKELVEYIISELGEFMAPDWLGRTVSLNNLWNLNRTLIVSYENGWVESEYETIWPKVHHAWADTRDTPQLFQFLNRSMELRSEATYLWAAMSHLTPSALDVILNPSGGIRILNNRISRHLSTWYMNMWWDKANIVASDFILSNDIISSTIQGNRKREICRSQSLS